MKRPRKIDLNPAPPPVFSRRFSVETMRDKKISTSIEADARELGALAGFLGLAAIAFLRAGFELRLLSRGRIEVTGTVEARITQACVASLEAFDSDIREPIDVIFLPPPEPGPGKPHKGAAADFAMDDPDDLSDTIVEGRIDLGALAAEFLALALDPYPRKPGADFDAGGAADRVRPTAFAALAKLREEDPSET